MSKDRPLSVRLYQDPVYFELARLVGYAGKPVDQLVKESEPLLKEHGRHAMNLASQELIVVNDAAEPPMATLNPHARKLCFQLLGPAPEQEDAFYRHPDGTPRERPAKPEPKVEPKPETNGKAKKPRKRTKQ